MIDYEGSWDRHIPLVEFVYNNSFQLSIGMAPYEALYGRKCRTPLCWTELHEKKVIGLDLIQDQGKGENDHRNIKGSCG